MAERLDKYMQYVMNPNTPEAYKASYHVMIAGLQRQRPTWQRHFSHPPRSHLPLSHPPRRQRPPLRLGAGICPPALMTAVFLAPDPVSAIQRAEQRVQRAAARARNAARENEKSRGAQAPRVRAARGPAGTPGGGAHRLSEAASKLTRRALGAVGPDGVAPDQQLRASYSHAAQRRRGHGPPRGNAADAATPRGGACPSYAAAAAAAAVWPQRPPAARRHILL